MVNVRFYHRSWLCLPVLMIFFLMAHPATTEAQFKKPVIKFGLESAFATHEQLPFWLYSMHYGRIDRRSPNMIAHFSVGSEGKLSSKWNYQYGAELIGRESKVNALYFEKLYAGISYGIFQFKIGRFYEIFGLHDSTLSTGSLIYSHNMTPLPKVAIYTPNFVKVPYTRGFVSFKAYYSEGLLYDNRIVKKAHLHQKYFYIKIFPDSFWFNGFGGITHNVEWGGRSPIFGQMTSTLGDYLRVVLARHARKTTDLGGDIVNKIGNTVSTYDFAFTLKKGQFHALVYRQFYLEDTPDMAFRSAWDGRWGVSITRRGGGHLIDRFVWEHIHFIRQGSQYSLGEPPGTDNYYNNWAYPSGYTYNGYTMGSPFATTKPGYIGVVNNKILVQHFAIAGSFTSDLSYQFAFDYSRNRGADSIIKDGTGLKRVPGFFPPKDQYSSFLTLNWDVNPWITVNGTAAADFGQLYSNNVGMLLGITYTLH